MSERFKEELSRVPLKPGVYIMRDDADKVLYVGKAVVLRNRLRSYFSKTPHNERISKMISHINRFEYIVCDTEFEAFLLENNLIKKYRPKYNVLLKDDKGYPYIKVTLNEQFPRVRLSHRIEKDGAKYFGPYFSGLTVRKTLDTLKNILPLRMCNKKLSEGMQDRPCLNYHIGLCRGVCCGKITKEEYDEIVQSVIEFLSGHTEKVEEHLRNNMLKASDNMEFELAAVYRDRLKALEKIRASQKISSLSELDYDAIACARSDVDVCVQVFFVRAGQVIGREFFIIDGAANAEDSEIITSFIQQFYNENQFIPPQLYVGSEGEYDELAEYLTQLHESRCRISVPQRGEKKKLCDMVRGNAEIALVNRDKAMLSGAAGAQDMQTLEVLKQTLNLTRLPMRIEAYDISNLGDSEINSSMVVFIAGKPVRAEYRLFKMKKVVSASDTDSMAETLQRRFTRYKEGSKGFDQMPDLLLIDGGIGQVNAVRAVLRDMGIDVDVLGMVKDDHHRSRSLVGNVTAEVAERNLHRDDYTEFMLKEDVRIWRLITAVQNEAHRAAVTYNRKLTEKRYKKSELDDIKGVGEKRRILLYRHFGSIAAIKNASVDELSDVQGIGKHFGEVVYAHFHGEDARDNDVQKDAKDNGTKDNGARNNGVQNSAQS